MLIKAETRSKDYFKIVQVQKFIFNFVGIFLFLIKKHVFVLNLFLL